MFRYVTAFAVGVLAVLVTSPATAVHKGPCHGKGCANGQPEPGTSAVIRDADGKLVGALLNLDPNAGIVLLNVDGDTFAARVSPTSPDGFLQNVQVAFPEPDCDIDPFVPLDIFYGINVAVIIDGIAYLPEDADPVPMKIERKSELQPDGTCVNETTFQSGLVFARTVILDFLGPFSLVLSPTAP